MFSNNASRLKRVILTSDFGTGKTTLLKSRIEKVAKFKPRKSVPPASMKKNIFVVIFLEKKSLLVQSMLHFAEKFLDVEVLFLKPQLGKSCCHRQLEDLS